ncbi:kinase [Nakamurella aerolata]|uniref:Kinase n=1 Tax=Nakamurella aerolata TaxID=1656892 RepID=A0A849A9W7_9ACTN|nr:kinase [Nakamurella aerolata]NNG37335.1 kinase [Nakamurella aerolata]
MTIRLIGGHQGIDQRAGVGTAMGTFGELLQGALPGGREFLVTLPIALWSHVSVRLAERDDLVVFPAHKVKARTVAQRMLRAAGHPGGGTLVIDSQLPTGKGLASSSADLVATVRAVGRCLDVDTSPEAVEEWLRGIEPTDGVMYPGIVAFDHREVSLRSVLGPVPPLTVVAVDAGGRVDTIAFNQHKRSFTDAEQRRYAVLLEQLSVAVADADVAALGRVATESGELNQSRNHHKHLAAVQRISRSIEALGVVSTHSGTMVGVLLDMTDIDYAPKLLAARRQCAAIAGRAWVFHTATPGADDAI